MLFNYFLNLVLVFSFLQEGHHKCVAAYRSEKCCPCVSRDQNFDNKSDTNVLNIIRRNNISPLHDQRKMSKLNTEYLQFLLLHNLYNLCSVSWTERGEGWGGELNCKSIYKQNTRAGNLSFSEVKNGLDWQWQKLYNLYVRYGGLSSHNSISIQQRRIKQTDKS